MDIPSRRQRYLKDPHQIRIGGLASNLSRIGWFMRQVHPNSSLAPIFRESKYFIEWVADESSPDLQNLLANIQIELASWQRHVEKGAISEQMPVMAESRSRQLLQAVGLV